MIHSTSRTRDWWNHTTSSTQDASASALCRGKAPVRPDLLRLPSCFLFPHLAAFGAIRSVRQQEGDALQLALAGRHRLGRVPTAGQDGKVVGGDRNPGAGHEPASRRRVQAEPGDMPLLKQCHMFPLFPNSVPWKLLLFPGSSCSWEEQKLHRSRITTD